MLLICGRYEGVDERVAEHLADDEISIGNYVLSGGELAAAVVIDAVARLLPGVLGNETSAAFDSFQDTGHGEGLLDCPHWTRPAEFRGWKVPDVLLERQSRRNPPLSQADRARKNGPPPAGSPGGIGRSLDAVIGSHYGLALSFESFCGIMNENE